MDVEAAKAAAHLDELVGMYDTIRDNETYLSSRLGDLILERTTMVSGFNALIRLHTGGREPETLCRDLYTDGRIAAFPLGVFIASDEALQRYESNGTTWLRISLATEPAAFRAGVDALRDVLLSMPARQPV